MAFVFIGQERRTPSKLGYKWTLQIKSNLIRNTQDQTGQTSRPDRSDQSTRPVRPVSLRHCQFWLPTLLQHVCLFFLIIMVTKIFLAAVQHGCDWFADPLPTHIIRKYYAEPWLEILNTLYLRMLCFGEFLPLNLSCICGLKCWI